MKMGIKRICNSISGSILLNSYKIYVLPVNKYGICCNVYTKTQIDTIANVQSNITNYICYKLGFTDLSYKQRLEQ